MKHVTSWSFGGNSLPQYRSGAVWLYSEPLWCAIAFWFITHVIGFQYRWLRWFKYPKSVFIVRDGERISLRDYFGDLASTWHVYVVAPCFQWYFKLPQRKEIRLELGWDKLRENLEPIAPAYFKEDDERRAQIKKFLSEKD